MFDDLPMLTGQALAREAQRELYGIDADGPVGVGHHAFLEYDRVWGVGVGNAMVRNYNDRAASLGLPRILADRAVMIGNDNRHSDFALEFTGGFTIKYRIADPLDAGLHIGIVLHRLIRRAMRTKGRPYSHG